MKKRVKIITLLKSITTILITIALITLIIGSFINRVDASVFFTHIKPCNLIVVGLLATAAIFFSGISTLQNPNLVIVNYKQLTRIVIIKLLIACAIATFFVHTLDINYNLSKQMYALCFFAITIIGFLAQAYCIKVYNDSIKTLL